LSSDIKKPIVFSGIQPTGGFQLGNLLGALKNWELLQRENFCIYSIVDLHSITVRNDPEELKLKITEAAAMLLALGVSPEKSILFIQSQVSSHAELSWILSCYTQFGELSRMTQFKDKSSKNPENVNAGLFTYPVLMAADILLYNTDLVPVGDDQRQHIEITRVIANRFNNIYGDVFKIPEGVYPKVASRVMSLADPKAKMSKSDPNKNARIMMTDENDAIRKKVRRAVTDSDNQIRRGIGKEGIENLMEIYSACTNKSLDCIESEFAGKNYGEFKNQVADALISLIEPLREKYKELMKDKKYVFSVLKTGKEKAMEISEVMMKRVNEAIGLGL